MNNVMLYLFCNLQQKFTCLYLNKENLFVLSRLSDFVVCSTNLFLPKMEIHILGFEFEIHFGNIYKHIFKKLLHL